MLRLLLWRCCDWSKRHGRHCTISGLHTFWFLAHGGNGVTSDKAPCLAFVRTYMLGCSTDRIVNKTSNTVHGDAL